MLYSTHVNHVSVSPTNAIEPTQRQRKTLARVGIEPTTFALDHPSFVEFYYSKFLSMRAFSARWLKVLVSAFDSALKRKTKHFLQ